MNNIYMLNTIPKYSNTYIYMTVTKHIKKPSDLIYNNIWKSNYKVLMFYWFVWDPSWSLHPCGEYRSPSLFIWMGEILCRIRIFPFLHYFHEDKIIFFSVHNIYLDVPLFLNRGLLLENIGECIKILPCSIQQNDHGPEIVLNWIKYYVLILCLILLEVDFPFIGVSLLYHYGYITIKVMLFNNI